ncbi:MAG: hypothetical protein R3E76_15320 [Planctomycetota bacterium]
MEPTKVVTLRELMEELPGGQLLVAFVEDAHGARHLVANLYSVACYCEVSYCSLLEWVEQQGYTDYVRTDNNDDHWYDREIAEEFMLRAFKGLLGKPGTPEDGEGQLSKQRPNKRRKKRSH